MWIENKNSYRIRQVICVILGICVSLLLVNAVLKRQEVVAARRLSYAQMELSDEVFRFHVLANSDSEEDQELKLKVRDAVLHYMKDYIADENDFDVTRKGQTDKNQNVKLWAAEHLTEIEQAAQEVILKEGYSYPVNAQVLECYFPDRRYGDILFPKGYYEALRVEIGNAKGHNWWCVLYPSLCFTDATCAVVTEEGEQELSGVLSKDTYETVTATSGNFKIKSFFYELFKERTADNMEEGQ